MRAKLASAPGEHISTSGEDGRKHLTFLQRSALRSTAASCRCRFDQVLSLPSVTLLSVSNVGISFGATELFKNITFTVAEGERWGIIGRNGAGKTSIFKVITGDLVPTAGSVARRPGLRHALLDQHRAFEGATTVWQAGAAAWREVMALEESHRPTGHRAG